MASAAVLLPVLSVALSFVHPWGDVRGVSRGGELLSGSPIPQEVRHTMESKCADCHSNQTHWPVYSRLAPGSWLMERDVHDGRAAMNLSAWNRMRTDERISILTRITAKVRSGASPEPG
jgi:cytochrome c